MSPGAKSKVVLVVWAACVSTERKSLGACDDIRRYIKQSSNENAFGNLHKVHTRLWCEQVP